MAKFYAKIQQLDTLPKKHSDLIDSFCYAMASTIVETQNNYILLHIKKKPKFLPKFIYKYVLSKVLVLNYFSK